MKKNNRFINSIILFCFTCFLLSFLIINYYTSSQGEEKSIFVLSRFVESKNSPGHTTDSVEKDKATIRKNESNHSNVSDKLKGENKQKEEKEQQEENKIDNEEKKNNNAEVEKSVDSSKEVSLLAVGDNLIHIEVYKSGKNSDGTYNYDHLYANLKNDIKKADIAVINQETILGDQSIGYSGYPNFCSPKEIGLAEKKAGFNVILQATNHSLDKGIRGLEYTLSFWKKQKDITLLGINDSQKERDQIRIIKKNGITFALLNYTQFLNGHVLPINQSYMVDTMEEIKMKEDIKKAKKLADIVIVFPHWGLEYNYKPDEKQKYYTDFFAKEGVDLVIGTHPHVLQPVEWVKGKNGHKTLVYYSLGNYVSFQREAPRMLGGMAEIIFKKDEKGAYIDQAKITPVVTHYENNNGYKIGVYKLSDYTKELASRHGILKLEKESYFSLDNLKKLAKSILGSWYLE